MRTAESIAADVFNQWAFSQNEREAMIKIINVARKECLEECARVVKIKRYHPDILGRTETALGSLQQDSVDKESILNLIKELK